MKLGVVDSLLLRRWLAAVPIAAMCGLLVLWSGGGEGIERQLREVRDGIRSHAASGEIHIVEIDSVSLRRIAQWPWPRRHHGALVDRLREAGVRSIGFDVDFSSPSNPVDDAAFAAALARAGGATYLATFSQRLSSGSQEVVDNVPIGPLRDQAFLAAVNVVPDADGQVRSMLLGVETDSAPRPALAAMIAERTAGIGESFPIDYAIDPATIPRHSYADILAGRVPAAALRGKRVLVGATAVELGDRYAAPRNGVIPGVVIQALAAETLLAGPLPSRAHPGWALALALLTILLTTSRKRAAATGAIFGLGTAAVLVLPLAGEQYWATTFPVVPALAAFAVALCTAFAFDLLAMFRRRARVDSETGLPNLTALAALAEAERGTVVVARIDRFTAIASGLGPAATINLIHRVADRLRFGQERAVYRLDEAHLGWVEKDGDKACLEQTLEALIALMRSPIDCGRLVDISLAFGIAVRDGTGGRQQAARASLAAERAAQQGARFTWFEADADDETDWHLSLLGELDTAMANGEVWNAYQPKFDIATGRIAGAEALVRWDHPQRGPIAPDRFIPLVEAHDRARDLTLNVLGRALDRRRRLARGGARPRRGGQRQRHPAARRLLRGAARTGNPGGAPAGASRHPRGHRIGGDEGQRTGARRAGELARARSQHLDRRLRDRPVLAQLFADPARDRAQDRQELRRQRRLGPAQRHHGAVDHRAGTRAWHEGRRGRRRGRRVPRPSRRHGLRHCAGLAYRPADAGLAIGRACEGRETAPLRERHSGAFCLCF